MMTRGVRDYLVRLPGDDDGIILARSSDPVEDLIRVLNPTRDEEGQLRDSVGTLIDDGFLAVSDTGAVTIKNFAEAQTTRSVAAAKKARQRRAKSAKPPRNTGSEKRGTAGDNRGDKSGDTKGDSPGTVPVEEKRREEIPPTVPPGGSVASSSRPQAPRRPARDPMPDRDIRKPAELATRRAFEHWRQTVGKLGAKPDPKRLGLLWDRYAERPDTWADDWPRVVAGAVERAKALRVTPESGIRPERVIDISHICHDAEIFERYRDWGQGRGPIDLEAEYS